MSEQLEPIRIDKWLWAARFFKTRSLAAEAVSGGKVDINGDRARPSRIVRAGDKLCVRRGPYEWIVVVKDVCRQRGPAAQAQRLYDETAESVQQRQAVAARLKLEGLGALDAPGRPTKRDRRAISRFTKRNW
jgi:ribosome-associated heat shock protein Hsp15